MTWTTLGTPAPHDLVAARQQMHWAAQVAAAAAHTLLEPEPDSSHTASEWVDELEALMGARLADGRRVGIVPHRMEWIVARDGGVVASSPAHGKTLDQGYSWAAEVLGVNRELTRPDYELEDHPIAGGGTFNCAELAPFAELGRWFKNTAELLAEIIAREPGAGPVLCWPHHFDIATLLDFDPDEPDREAARSAGLGMTPGDAAIAEPYLYIGPWPRPTTQPALSSGGEWREGGWMSLRGTTLVAATDQAASARAFFADGLQTSKTLLGIE